MCITFHTHRSPSSTAVTSTNLNPPPYSPSSLTRPPPVRLISSNTTVINYPSSSSPLPPSLYQARRVSIPRQPIITTRPVSSSPPHSPSLQSPAPVHLTQIHHVTTTHKAPISGSRSAGVPPDHVEYGIRVRARVREKAKERWKRVVSGPPVKTGFASSRTAGVPVEMVREGERVRERIKEKVRVRRWG